MKVNTVGKMLSEVNRAYIAGFFDADGAIMATIERHKEKKFRFRVRVIIKITQQNPKILHWFRSKTKMGYIAQNRTTFDWITKDQKQAKELLIAIFPYLKSKKKQATLAKQIIEKKINSLSDLLKVARLADALSRFNVRSRNRRKNFMAMIQESVSRND